MVASQILEHRRSILAPDPLCRVNPGLSRAGHGIGEAQLLDRAVILAPVVSIGPEADDPLVRFAVDHHRPEPSLEPVRAGDGARICGFRVLVVKRRYQPVRRLGDRIEIKGVEVGPGGSREPEFLSRSVKPCPHLGDESGDLGAAERIGLAPFDNQTCRSRREPRNQLVEEGRALRLRCVRQLLHGLGLPLVPVQVFEDGKKSHAPPHAEQTNPVRGLFPESPLHARKAEPIRGDMGQGIGMSFQRHQGSRVPWSDITQGHLGVGCRRRGRAGTRGGSDTLPVILDIPRGQGGRRERPVAGAEIAQFGGKEELRCQKQAPCKGSGGRQKEHDNHGGRDPEDDPADPPGIGKDTGSGFALHGSELYTDPPLTGSGRDGAMDLFTSVIPPLRARSGTPAQGWRGSADLFPHF